MMEKRIKVKSTKGEKNEDINVGIIEVENIGRDMGVERALRIDKVDIVGMKKRKRDKETKEVKGTKDAEEVSMENKRANEDKVIGVYVEEGHEGVDNAERKKKKKKKREKNKNKYEASSHDSSHDEDFVEMAKRKKKKSWKNKNDEAGLAKYAEDNIQSTTGDGNGMKKSAKDNKRKKKKENCNDDSSATEQEVFTQDSADNDGNSILGMNETRVVEVENADKVKKKNKKSVENDPNDLRANKSNKKVRFSGHVDVFPPLDDSNPKKGNNEEDNLVRGKRFTPEEDEIVKEAVFKYILEHELGEHGLNMVLNCKKYPNVKRCWKEIGTAISYRPYRSIYRRAHVLFRRSKNRNWTQEECERILKYQEEHGNRWKALADELGRHRWHVKDTWRRIKLRNLKKGRWSQKEYQKLFSLVNYDLQLKVFEEKRSKHGMLRDNICWTAISDKLSSRSQANCCLKWYYQLASPMVSEGLWADIDDFRLVSVLFSLDARCIEGVDWDDLLDHRCGDVCRKRWNQMVMHIGHYRNKSFGEQVEVLAQRYCPYLLEVREAWDSKPRVP